MTNGPSKTLAVASAVLCIALFSVACGSDSGGGGGSAFDNMETTVNDGNNNGNGNGSTGVDDAVLADQQDAENWSDSSAPATFIMASTFPILIALDEDGEMPDCPNWDTDETTGVTQITGGCTDEEGRDWSGSMTIHHLEPGQGESLWFPDSPYELNFTQIQINNLGFQGIEVCESDESVSMGVEITLSGSITLQSSGADAYDFAIDLDMEGHGIDHETCESDEGSVFFDYQGGIEILEYDAHTGEAISHRWNGSGSHANPDDGRADLSTVDELFHRDDCAFKPLSGSTTVSSGGTELQYVYDGETNCDELATATWYLDGDEMGVVEGVTCSSAKGAPVQLAAVFMMLVLVAVRRHRAEI